MGVTSRKTKGMEVSSVNLVFRYLRAKRLDTEIIAPDLAMVSS